MKSFAARLLKDEAGATAIEYGLIVALIAVVIISAVTALGRRMKNLAIIRSRSCSERRATIRQLL
ncbi:MAG: Flp family type IVb pilin [Caulobacteraceae bacterium]